MVIPAIYALLLAASSLAPINWQDYRLASGRGPANATTLIDFFHEVSALSGDPVLNGTPRALA
jgi:hypothetical protein